jgi:hypothetical protein
VTEGLFVVSFSSSEVLLLLPPHPLLHEDFLFSVHLAYTVIGHVVHVEILVIHVVNCASVNHPSKVYHSFVGFSNVIESFIVYQVRLFSLFVHQFNSYVIIYISSLNTPVKLHPVVTVSPSQSVNHPEKAYHSSEVPVATTVHEIDTVPASSSREIEFHSSASILHVLTLPHSDPVKLRIKD